MIVVGPGKPAERVKFKAPLKDRLLQFLRIPAAPFIKLLVMFYAFSGRYPNWMVTPDDPVSPFGSGTTALASREPGHVAIYAWGSKIHPAFGRWLGDVVWLAWRNSMYGLAYRLKPDWLKRPGIAYETLEFDQESDGNVKTFWLRCPDDTWLWERQRKVGPFVILSGYRIEPIIQGAQENLERIANGLPRAQRPPGHPNMDGRPILSIRTARTM